MTVTRHSFFQRYGEPSISFVEGYPPGGELDAGHGCNCTRYVTERPDGSPDRVVTSLEIRLVRAGATRRDEEVIVRFDAGETSFHFRWGHRPVDRHDRRRATRGPSASNGDFEEASFSFSATEPALKVGVWTSTEDRTLPESVRVMEEYGARYFDAHVYQSRAIDVSRFMNGHVPSRVVRFGRVGEDLDVSGEVHPATDEALANGRRVGDDDVWLHCLSHVYGGEAFGVLEVLEGEDRVEATSWRSVFGAVREIGRAWRTIADDDVLVVDVARRARASAIGEGVTRVSTVLSAFLDRVGETDLFRLAHALRREADRRGHERLEADERERDAFWAANPELRVAVDGAYDAQVASGQDPVLGPLREFFAERGKVLVEVTLADEN